MKLYAIMPAALFSTLFGSFGLLYFLFYLMFIIYLAGVESIQSGRFHGTPYMGLPERIYLLPLFIHWIAGGLIIADILLAGVHFDPWLIAVRPL